MNFMDGKPPANNAAPPPPQDAAPGNDFSNVIETILNAAELRDSSPPLWYKEISQLSMLCELQSSRKGGIADDLGFADVDPDLIVSLMETLEKHVASASSVEIHKEAMAALMGKKQKYSVEQWLQGPGGNLMHSLRLGLEAAAILLFIITSPGIDGRVVNEDAIEASIVLFRHHLAKNILPAMNQTGHITSASIQEVTPSKKRRRSSTSGGEAILKKVYKQVFSTVGFTVLVMERLDTLVQKVPLDDQQLLTISSGALVSLELDPANESGINMTHQLHVATIGTVTSIFRKYPRHRQIIVEDLFPILLKMPTHKKSMRTYPIQCSSVLYPSGLLALSKSLVPGENNHHPNQQLVVQTISVVILSFVQSCVVRPNLEMEEEAPQRTTDGSSVAPKLRSGLRDCQGICEMFVHLLLQRCSKKGEDGGASEFRPILSNLIDDFLFVVLVPEYPAAEMILRTIANTVSRDLSRAAQKVDAETTYLNTAFDALGKICAAEARILKSHRTKPVKLQVVVHSQEEEGQHADCYCQKKKNPASLELMLGCDRCCTWYHAGCVGLSRETVPQIWHCDACQLKRIIEFERDRNTNLGGSGVTAAFVDEPYCMRRLLIDYLSIVSRKTGAVGVQDAYELHVARSISELSSSSSPGSSSSHASGGGGGPITDPSKLPLFARLMELWDPRESSNIHDGMQQQGSDNTLNGMLHCLSDEGRGRMVVHLASTKSSLLGSFRSQVGFIVKLMSSDSSALLRRLAVKAIEKITDADEKLMIYPFIKKAVTQRFSDEAISVREAAVSLVGSYVVQSPAVANAFHSAFMVGLNDPGVSVRKRTIKILQDILCNNPGYKGRAAACSEMLRLAADPKEDDGVRDLIHGLFLKVWLENGDELVVQEVSPAKSPVSTVKSPPVSYVDGIEETTGAGIITPTPEAQSPGTPAMHITRSAEKKLRTTRLQHRSEIAAEQMMEVVKAADTGDNLTALFRELLSGVSDADKGRKSSERRKRQVLAQSHCAMLVDALFEILLLVEEKPAVTGAGKELVAILRTIRVFTDVAPVNVLRHLDTVLPYLQADNGLRMQDEAVIVGSVCDAMSQVATVLEKDELERLGTMSLAEDVVKITYKFGREALSSAVRALCALAHHKCADEKSPFRTKLLKLAQTFYKVLFKHHRDKDLSEKKVKARANVHRALSVLGNVCRYHETAEGEHMMEEVEDIYDGDEETMMQLTWSNLTALCERMFTIYLEKNDTQTKCAALRALSGVFIAHPRELLRLDQSGLITRVMSRNSPSDVQIESLRCWRDILLTEEARIESGEAKKVMDSKKNITVSKKIAGDQDADATLFGGVLTNHASRLFHMTQVRDKTLRFQSLDLIGHLLRQGQVNPNETVPYLLALQGDVEEDGIRSLALKFLMIEGEKRPDMLRQRVCAGVKQAYAFQKYVYPHLQDVSALIKVKKHNGALQTECVFGAVFKECIGSIKKQRQGLIRNLLGLFDLQNRKNRQEANGKKPKISVADAMLADLPLLCFTSQVLAYLPYAYASDPLYIIHNISSTLALQGADLLDRLAAFLRPYGLASSDEMDENNVEEDDLEIAAKRQTPRHAKEATPCLKDDFDTKTFSGLCCECGSLSLLLRLKSFLRKAYNLSEARCLGYNPEAKERIAEKAISRASTLIFESQSPMTSSHGEDTTDIDRMIHQYADFRQLMRDEAHVEMKLDDDSEDENAEGTNSKRKRIESMDEDDDEMADEEV